MKKSKIKNLNLNQRSVSNLTGNEVKGGFLSLNRDCIISVRIEDCVNTGPNSCNCFPSIV